MLIFTLAFQQVLKQLFSVRDGQPVGQVKGLQAGGGQAEQLVCLQVNGSLGRHTVAVAVEHLSCSAVGQVAQQHYVTAIQLLPDSIRLYKPNLQRVVGMAWTAMTGRLVSACMQLNARHHSVHLQQFDKTAAKKAQEDYKVDKSVWQLCTD